MVAPVARSDRAVVRQHRAVRVPLAQAILAAATAMLVALACYLVWRRACAGLQQPLSGVLLWAMGAGAAGLVAAIRGGWCWVGMPPLPQRWPAAVLWLLPTLAVLTLLAALSLPGTSRLGGLAAWGSVLAGEAVWLALVRRARPAAGAAPPPAAAAETGASSCAGPAQSPWQLPVDLRADGQTMTELRPDVSQQLTRFQSPQQGDVAEGLLRTRFAAGQRSRNVHVAFCPPMSGRPRVDVAQVAGPATRVKVADAQAFGIRFDVRLHAASPHEENVLIHFQARCEP
ncbi:MAG: hypothetical protein MUF48_00370 [Pirellulaceae bacterium]|jgi:hypothetical protein|nr:hypothetical protein [Pirellulaceae bacterium]